MNTLRALEDALESFAGCVLVISHGRWFLDRIATHILAFEGESTVDFFDGNVRWMGGWHDAGCTAVGRGRGGSGVAGAVGGAARRPRNFSEYEEDRTSRLGDEATRPHRITYRKLTR